MTKILESSSEIKAFKDEEQKEFVPQELTVDFFIHSDDVLDFDLYRKVEQVEKDAMEDLKEYLSYELGVDNYHIGISEGGLKD